MTDIKTRDVTRGSIKTLDHAESYMHHIKEATVKTKTSDLYSRQDDSADNYAQDKIGNYAGDSAAFTAQAGAEIILRNREEDTGETAQNTEMIQRAFREEGVKIILSRQERAKMADAEVIRNNEGFSLGDRVINSSKERKSEIIQRIKGKTADNSRKLSNNAEIIQRTKRDYAIRRITSGREQSSQTFLPLLRSGRKGRERKTTSDTVSGFLRYIWEHARSYILAVGGGTAAAVIIVTLFVFFGIGVITFSNNSPDTSVTEDPEAIEYFIPDLAGSPTRQAIVKAAAREVGNVGGEKFWRWYGFKSHVHWCACFTSYIAAECGCIQSGICPKSALVDDWESFYRKQHRWAGGNYIPHSGDFIIFDWEGDGQPDHIGIVESCDGKTVYTIEGNSRDVCRRKSYARGSWMIYGYGCPNYSGT